MKQTTSAQRQKFLRKLVRIENLRAAFALEMREFFKGDGDGEHSQCCPLGGMFVGLNGASGKMPCACGAGDDAEYVRAREWVAKDKARRR